MEGNKRRREERRKEDGREGRENGEEWEGGTEEGRKRKGREGGMQEGREQGREGERWHQRVAPAATGQPTLPFPQFWKANSAASIHWKIPPPQLVGSAVGLSLVTGCPIKKSLLGGGGCRGPSVECFFSWQGHSGRSSQSSQGRDGLVRLASAMALRRRPLFTTSAPFRNMSRPPPLTTSTGMFGC